MLWRDVFRRGDEFGNLFPAVGSVHALLRWRVELEADAGTARGFRPYRPWHEAAAAVRTDVLQQAVDAVAAKRALVGANTGFGGIGR